MLAVETMKRRSRKPGKRLVGILKKSISILKPKAR
jgi:hypothetical protein